MLDPKGTFDDLIQRYSDTAEQAEDIQVNRIYRNLTGTLSGTQEYMAMEKLYELVEEGGFDLVVVDTPPSRNALDFLDAPRRLTRFLENRLFQALMKPTRAGLRVMGVAAQALLRTISKVAGADIVHDAVAFFQAFEGMEEGFRIRAARVRELLVQPGTAFVLVASPRPDSVDEAVHFAGKLAESDMAVDRPGASTGSSPVSPPTPSWRHCPLPAAGTATGPAPPWPTWSTTCRATRWPRTARRPPTPSWWRRSAPAPVYRVPLLDSDVHDLDGLAAVADLLFARTARESSAAESGTLPPLAATGHGALTSRTCDHPRGQRRPVGAGRGRGHRREPGHRPSSRPVRSRGDGRGGRVDARPGGRRPADGQHGRHGRCLELRLEESYGKLAPRAGADAARPAPRRVPGPAIGGRGLGGEAARPDPAAAGDHRAARRRDLLRRVLHPAVRRVRTRSPAGA